MELMQRDSTEKRLDDLNGKVDQGLQRIDADVRGLRAESRTEFTALRGEMKDGFDALRGEMKKGFESMNDRFESMNGRFEAMHRLMIQVGGGLIGTLIVASAGLIATQI